MAKLDCLVLGMGPTAWLLQSMPTSVLDGKRLFGAHDIERIVRVNDIVIFDLPENELHPDRGRHEVIVRSRPDNFWLYDKNSGGWVDVIPKDVPTKQVAFKVWPGFRCSGHEPFSLGDPPQTYAISPLGCTTLAWSMGCRRIGVLGCDMMPGHHHTFGHSHQADAFFTRISRQAQKEGGLILNLSPVTSLANFAAVSQQHMIERLRGEAVPAVRNVFANDMSAPTL